jgi:hypothetical protein
MNISPHVLLAILLANHMPFDRPNPRPAHSYKNIRSKKRKANKRKKR